MKKHYRIVRIDIPNYHPIYTIQERFLFFFWKDCTKVVGFDINSLMVQTIRLEFNSVEDAMNEIKRMQTLKLEPKITTTVVKTVTIK